MFKPEEYAKGRCDGCKDRRRVHAQNNYSFYGCYHRPYTGKRVAEIKDCPKEDKRCQELEPCNLKGIEPASDKRPCIGYQKSQTDDEPCEMCKRCWACDGEEPEREAE